MTSDAQKRARSEVAMAGLAYLLSSDGPASRKDIFVPDTRNRLQVDQALKKPWQTQLLDRLVSDGIVAKIDINGQVAYQAASRARITDLLQDFKQGGLKLASYLWPNQVSVPKPVTEESDEPEPENGSPPTHTALATLGTVVRDEDDEEEHDVAALLSELLRSQTANAKSISTVLTMVADNMAAVRGSVDELAKVISGLISLSEKNEGKVEQKFGGMNKRLEAVEERIAATHSLAEANHKVVKGFSADTELIKQVGTTLQMTLSEVRAAIQESVTLRQAVDALLAQHKKTEADQLGKLLKKLEANTSEGLALRDLIVSAIAEGESRSK